MHALMWILVLLGAMAGVGVLVLGTFTPQASALACALAVLPYVTARAFDELSAKK